VATDSTTYTVPGTWTWTCPAGINTVQIECWGAGGNGGDEQSGGGGGAYSKKNSFAVSRGVSYSVGVSNTAWSGYTWFNNMSTCYAQSGYGGSYQESNNSKGGSDCLGDTTYIGGNGATGSGPDGGGAGGGAGSSGNGGNASGMTGGAGGNPDGGAGGNGGDFNWLLPTNGYAPGGGGGGNYEYYSTTVPGKPGQVKLTWTVPINVVQNVITKKASG